MGNDGSGVKGLLICATCCLIRSTLVCDSVSEAKRIAFMGPERHKVVALDGTLIGKQGFITGGMSGNEAARASRWNDSALEGLKKVSFSLSANGIACSPCSWISEGLKTWRSYQQGAIP